jgi:rRNA-processing protein FCF1
MNFLLDASFLVSAVRFKVDIIGELSKFSRPELFILSSVVEELEKIGDGRGKDAAYGRTGLDIIKKLKAEIIQSQSESADEEMVKLSGDFIVCTADKKLAAKIRKSGNRVVSIRQKKYLEMV